jgi:hypothetical protein
MYTFTYHGFSDFQNDIQKIEADQLEEFTPILIEVDGEPRFALLPCEEERIKALVALQK